MSHEDAIALLAQAEEQYHLKIFENISESTVKGRPLPRRLRAVGKAVMERTDYPGYVLGRRLLAAADEIDGRC